jgi:hypothetical protein
MATWKCTSTLKRRGFQTWFDIIKLFDNFYYIQPYWCNKCYVYFI